jgi:two-component system phosphate regulon response regulator PhoB
MQKNILVVEDSEEMQFLIKSALAPLRQNIYGSSTVNEAVKLINQHEFAIVILDLHLPDGDGLNVLNYLRQKQCSQKNMTLILSGNADVTSKISAFSIGADDYITKPFNILEFCARVESKLRKLLEYDEESMVIQVGPLILEKNKNKVVFADSKESIYLSPIEFRMLMLLARHPGNIYSREQILNHVWGDNINVTDRTVDTHIYTLRKKLGQYGALIKSVQKEGYRFSDQYNVDHFHQVSNF